MLRSSMLKIFIAVLLIALPVAAQQSRQSFGPVIKAYLNSLAEETRELDAQLRRQKISRNDYDRARQRLTLLRSLIESRVTESGEDRVPEFHLVTADDFATLGLSETPDVTKLKAGAILEDQWKLVRISTPAKPGGAKLFAFERTGADQRPIEIEVDEKMNALNAQPASVPAASIVETIVVIDETPWWLAQTNGADNSSATNSIAVIPPAKEAGTPRFLTFYLPVYTTEAREKKIEGDVVITAVFGGDNTIRDIRLVEGLGHGLDERAIEAIRKTSFEAARRDKQPIDVRTRVIYRFALNKVTVQVLSPGQMNQRQAQLRGSQP